GISSRDGSKVCRGRSCRYRDGGAYGLRPRTRRIAAGLAKRQHSKSMSRNFYILAATLGLFALLSGGMALVPSSFQPGLPANGTLWRTVALFLMLAALACALIGGMSNLFE